MYPVVTSVEGDRDLRLEEGFNRVPEHRVDIVVVEFDPVPAVWCTGAFEDEVDHPFLLLEGAG
jgi:hypothetical protein